MRCEQPECDCCKEASTLTKAAERAGALAVRLTNAQARIAELEAQVRQGIEAIAGLLSEADLPHSRVIAAEGVMAAMQAALRKE